MHKETLTSVFGKIGLDTFTTSNKQMLKHTTMGNSKKHARRDVKPGMDLFKSNRNEMRRERQLGF